jgi:hypothetical protein
MSFIISKIQAFIHHFISPLTYIRNQYNTSKYKTLRVFNFLIWVILIPLKFLEIFGFTYILNSIFKLFIKSRHLNRYEVEYLKTIFPNSINYQFIRINENSKWARIGAKNTKKEHLAFVWMNTINFTRPINCQYNFSDLRWLVHEMVHIAQFKTLGIQYIFEAFLAQKYGGYNYGGLTNLNKHQLKDFNLEQQADIIKDYVLDLNQNKDVTIYKTYLNDLQQYKF